MQRNIALAGVLSVVLIFAAVFAATFRKSASPSNTNESEEVAQIDTAESITATLTIAEGTVEQRTDGVWSKASKDLQITPGMSLKTTGAASRAAVEIADGTVVRIDAGTELKFETLTSSRIVIQQASGHLYNRVKPGTERAYIVQTKNAQFQSVGTAFQTIASGDEEAVEVYENSINETIKNIRVNSGEKLIAKSNVNPSKDGQKEKLDVEALKANLFVVWNRDLDKQNDSFKNSLGFLTDFDGPQITISTPPSGSNITVGSSSTQGTVQIGGSTDRGTKMTVISKSLAGSSPVSVPVDESGNFTTDSLTAPLGSSVFEFVGTDPVGNKTTVNVTYNFIKESSTQNQGISLSVDTSDNSTLKFGWILEGMTTPDGVYLVYGRSSNPSFDKSSDKKVLIKSGNATTLKSSEVKGKYYFRVCRFNADSNSCDSYSNELFVDTQ